MPTSVFRIEPSRSQRDRGKEGTGNDEDLAKTFDQGSEQRIPVAKPTIRGGTSERVARNP